MSNIQSILFPVAIWSIPHAKKWLKTHRYKYGKVETTNRFHRFRQRNPSKNDRYRIFRLSNSGGVEFILRYPK